MGCTAESGCPQWEGYRGCSDIDDCVIVEELGLDEDGDGEEDKNLVRCAVPHKS